MKRPSVPTWLRPLVPPALRAWRRREAEKEALLAAVRPAHPRHCPICDHRGLFTHFGRPPRIDAACTGCGSLERHRLFWLWFGADPARLPGPVLHFAPERVLERRLRPLLAGYRSADLFEPADLRLDIEATGLPDASIGSILCNHVLEHVDDRRAMAELHRILTPGGRLVCSVPIVEGWAHTYEDTALRSQAERSLHFGRFDHVRWYGRDFRDRLRAAGFARIDEITAEGPAVVAHALMPGEKLFVCHRAPASPVARP